MRAFLPTLLLCGPLMGPLVAFTPSLPGLPATLEDEEGVRKAPPDPEEIRAAVERLKRAFRGKDAAEKVAAVEAARAVVDGEVVHAIAAGIREPEEQVRLAVLEALRWIDHPAAVEELHSIYRREKRLRKDEGLYAALLRSIAQHGHPDSIPLLAEFDLSDMTYQVGKARVWGLAMIRAPESVEAIFDMMKRMGRGKLQPLMDEFRVALLVLTGVDNGRSQDAWMRWWNDNKRNLVVPPDLPRLPREVLRKWAAYWDLELPKERKRDRDGKGRDREGNGSGGRRRGGGER